MTKDFEGTDLVVGDSVAYIDTYTRQLKRGTVKGFTAKNVAVEYDVPGYFVQWRNEHVPARKGVILRENRYVVKVV